MAEAGFRILSGLLHRHFGDLRGKRVLDLACSGGYHAIELARQGAIVIGVDWDELAINQANFVSECIARRCSVPRASFTRACTSTSPQKPSIWSTAPGCF